MTEWLSLTSFNIIFFFARAVLKIWGGERLGEKPFSPLDPRQRWLIDRILDGSGGLTLKDVLNPGPWPHAEFNFSFHRPEKDQFEGGLEAIEEGDDDDEDW